MGKRYLIDSNTIIEYVGMLLPFAGHSGITAIIDAGFNISFINKIEVPGHTSAESQLRNFINLATMYEVNNDIIEQTINLRKVNKSSAKTALIFPDKVN